MSIYRAFSVAIFTVLLFVAGSRSVQAETPTLRVFTGSTAHWADLIVAIKKGFFTEQGLTVQPTFFTTGAAATESFLAGNGDVVLTCELASIGMWKRGSVVGISRQARLFDQEFLVVRGDIEKPSDLEGKIIATRYGSTVEYFLRKYLREEGVALDKLKIINLEPADTVIALDKGEIDGYTNYIPFPQLSLLATKSAKVLATSGKYIDENCIYSASKKAISEKKTSLVKFLKAIRKAQSYIPANMDEAVSISVAQFRGKPDDVRFLLEHMKFQLGYDRILRKNVEEVADFFDMGKIDWQNWFDPSVLAQAAPDLVEEK